MAEKNVTIHTLAEYLDGIGLEYMATIGLDGKPKVRPVQYMVVHNEKLWFCTNSLKAMYAEMQKSPFVEICGSRLQEDEINTAWIRFSAEAVFADDKTEEARFVKNAIMEKSSIVKELYKDNPETPIFKVFYLKNIKGSLCNLGHVKGLEDRKDFAKPVYFSF